MKWTPRDAIALVVILGAFGLIAMGLNGRVGWTLVAVIAAYYGMDLTPSIHLGRKQKPKKEK